MALGDSFVRVAGTVLAILKTRFELISIEVEEEWTRLLTYLLLSLAGLFCLALTILLAVILIIVLCWESYRIPAMVGLIVFFGLVTLGIAIGVKRSFARKPKMLALTCQEIAKDIDLSLIHIFIENTFDQDFDFTAGSLGTEKAGFQDFGIVENKQVAFGQMVDQVVKTGIGDLFFVNKQQA